MSEAFNIEQYMSYFGIILHVIVWLGILLWHLLSARFWHSFRLWTCSRVWHNWS